MPETSDLVDEIARNISSDELLRLAYDLVRIKSPTLHEEEISRYYHDLLESIGLDAYYQDVDGARKNVIGILKGEGGGRNLLVGGHLDTIPPETCVEPRIQGNAVYGRGAEDMKGALACMVIGAKALTQKGVRLRGDLIIAAWVGHEAPHGKGEGPRTVAKSIKERKLGVDSAVVVEGSMLDTVGTVQGGMAIFTITVKGASGGLHTTLVPLCSNPILWASTVIQDLYRMDGELNGKPSHPLIPQRPSIQLGVVNGGDFYNRLPKECKIIGTIRWDPDQDFSMVKERLLDGLNRVELSIWHGLDSSAKIDLDLQLVRDSYEVSEEEEIVKIAKRAVEQVVGKSVRSYGSRGVGDPSIFAKVADIPTIFYGLSLPDKMSAHSDVEWMDGDRLEKAARILTTLAILYCGIKGVKE